MKIMTTKCDRDNALVLIHRAGVMRPEELAEALECDRSIAELILGDLINLGFLLTTRPDLPGCRDYIIWRTGREYLLKHNLIGVKKSNTRQKVRGGAQ